MKLVTGPFTSNGVNNTTYVADDVDSPAYIQTRRGAVRQSFALTRTFAEAVVFRDGHVETMVELQYVFRDRRRSAEHQFASIQAESQSDALGKRRHRLRGNAGGKKQRSL